MERKIQTEVISSQKMEKFLEKLKNMPDSLEEKEIKGQSKREKFLQKILEEIGPQ